MEEEENQISKSKIFFALLIMMFGWGSLWVGNHGFKLAFGDTPIHLPDFKKIYTANVNVAIDNSGGSTIASDKDQNVENTNVISTPNKTPNNHNSSSLTIMIGGDVMLDRGIRLVGEKYGYNTLFASITPLFKQADIVAVNLEGPITSNKSKTVLANGKTGKELTFTFNPKVTKTLFDAGVTAVSLANNHSNDFGSAGLSETRNLLKKADIGYFGDYRNSSSTEFITEKNGFKIALVGYHYFQPGFDRIVQKVEELSSKGYFVLVMPHWDEEYATSSSPRIREQARILVSAGAKAILGSHPHVILERVKIGDVPVFYSLGNLLFDQHFSKEVMKGHLVELVLAKRDDTVFIDKIRIYETSTESKKGVTVNPTPLDF